jgi:peptidoglycan L-alanyl-D-glutamate endopeptidase CwlK
MNATSTRRLSQVHPRLADAVRAMAVDLETDGIVIEVVQGLRTWEEQDALYAKGRTTEGPKVTNAKGGSSFHNFGLAVDVCPFIKGKPWWDAPRKTWAHIGRAAKKHGLEWGGDWTSFVDLPHVQLPHITLDECRDCFRDGGIPAVWTKLGDA